MTPSSNDHRIAVIGLACRFPGADNSHQFWQNLCQGKESIHSLSATDCLTNGVSPELLHHPNYVKATPIITDYDKFDADFFDITPREAKTMDPQHRLFLEYVWHTLEDAGYANSNQAQNIGIYATQGTVLTSYVADYLNYYPEIRGKAPGFYANSLSNDYFATRAAYKLNLCGPALNIQTACSSAFVATHQACAAILDDTCDMALAGGVVVRLPHHIGYLYENGGIFSQDGHCRAFDANATGTLFGSGVGLILLKRFSQAVADHDRIYAVIKGSAINNDGSQKDSYPAPSKTGQIKCMHAAFNKANITPDSIQYIEAHGTATQVGDAIELASLSDVFNPTQKILDHKPLLLGSVKANIGHLCMLSGTASLIKMVLALYHKTIPPQINFTTPHPVLLQADCPCAVNTQLMHWQQTGNHPRRALTNSFGVGGTNAVILLEESPEITQSFATNTRLTPLTYPIIISAKTQNALKRKLSQIQHYCTNNPENIQHLAYTLACARQHFKHRYAFSAKNIEDIKQSIQNTSNLDTDDNTYELIFVFAGQGSQYATMGQQLYQHNPEFKTHIDHCEHILAPLIDKSLTDLLFHQSDNIINQTQYTQVAIFCIEISLFYTLKAYGVRPHKVMGHSLGEYVAAVAAGIMSLEQGLQLVAKRGQLVNALADDGGMLAVYTEPEIAIQNLHTFSQNNSHIQIELAAENDTQQCVFSGYKQDLLEWQHWLTSVSINSKILPVSHAFHSQLLEPMLAELQKAAQIIDYQPAKLPIISNVTADYQQTIDSEYWVKHSRNPVKFQSSIKKTLNNQPLIFIEISPHAILSPLIKNTVKQHHAVHVIPTLRKGQADNLQITQLLTQLFNLGININWQPFFQSIPVKKISLPEYPFEKTAYWFDKTNQQPRKYQEPLHDYFYSSDWQPTPLEQAQVIPTDHLGKKHIFIGHHKIFKQLKSLVTLPNSVCIDIALPINSDNHTDFDTQLFYLAQQWDIIKPCPTDNIINVYPLDPHFDHTTIQWQFQLYQKIFQLSGQHLPQQILLTPHIAHSLASVASNFMSGFFRSLRLEWPDFLFKQIRCDQFEQHILLFKQEIDSKQDNEVLFDHHRYINRIIPHTHLKNKPTLKSANLWRQHTSQGCYLITGGLGGLGLKSAQWLADQGAQSLLLVSRHSPSDNATAIIQQIQAQGINITIIQADVSQADQVNQLFLNHPSIQGIIHAAGILNQASFIKTSWQDFQQVIQAKCISAFYLHQAIMRYQPPLDFIIYYSSTAALFGGHGRAAYAGANAYLDGLADYQNQHAIPAYAIGWGAWDDVGMSLPFIEKMKTRGNTPLAPTTALACLPLLLDTKTNYAAITDIDWLTYIPKMHNKDARFSLLADLPAQYSTEKPQQASPRTSLSDLNDTERLAAIQTILQDELRKILAFPSQRKLDNSTDFTKLGLDSLLGIEFITALEKQFKLTRVFTNNLLVAFPNLQHFSQYIFEHLDIETSPAKSGLATQTIKPQFPINQQSLPLWLPLPEHMEFFWLATFVKTEQSPLCTYLKSEQTIDADKLATAINHIISNHPIFFTEIAKSQPYYRIRWRQPVKIQQYDLANTKSPDEILINNYKKRVNQAFDMTLNPLMIVELYYLPQNQCVCHITVPHSLIDGFSLNHLINSINSEYQGLTSGLEHAILPYAPTEDFWNIIHQYQVITQQNLVDKVQLIKDYYQHYQAFHFTKPYLTYHHKTQWISTCHCYSMDFQQQFQAQQQKLQLPSLASLLLALSGLACATVTGQHQFSAGYIYHGKYLLNSQNILGSLIKYIFINYHYQDNQRIIDFVNQIKENTVIESQLRESPFIIPMTAIIRKNNRLVNTIAKLLRWVIKRKHLTQPLHRQYFPDCAASHFYQTRLERYFSHTGQSMALFVNDTVGETLSETPFRKSQRALYLDAEPIMNAIMINSFEEDNQWKITIRSQFLTATIEKQILDNLDQLLRAFVTNPKTCIDNIISHEQH